MSKQHTPTPKYKVHEFRESMDIWTSDGGTFICSVPTDLSMDNIAKDKINFVLNILNNHDRLVEALESIVITINSHTYPLGQKGVKLIEEAKYLLTKLKHK